MKKLLILAFLLSSCAVANPPQGGGVFYTESKELVFYDPYVKPNKKARVCAENKWGFVSQGDLGFDAVRMASGIRKIGTIEKTYTSRFLIFAESCLVVTGE